jgi:hypothetical protein
MSATGPEMFNTVGTVLFRMNEHTVMLKDVAYVPSFKTNLLSITQLENDGYAFNFSQGRCTVMRHNKVLTQIQKRHDDMYVLTLHTFILPQITAFRAKHTHSNHKHRATIDFIQYNATKQKLKSLHHTLGHISYERIIHMVKNNSLTGFTVPSTFAHIRIMLEELRRGKCEGCDKGKMKRKTMTGVILRTVTEPMDEWHVDMMGKIDKTTIDGYSYMLVIVDVCNRYFIKNKR